MEIDKIAKVLRLEKKEINGKIWYFQMDNSPFSTRELEYWVKEINDAISGDSE